MDKSIIKRLQEGNDSLYNIIAKFEADMDISNDKDMLLDYYLHAELSNAKNRIFIKEIQMKN